MAMLAQGLRKSGKYRVFHAGDNTSVLSVVPRDLTPEEMGERLAEKGVATRAGLHCAPLAHMCAGTDRTGTLRFSASVFNTQTEVESVLRLMA